MHEFMAFSADQVSRLTGLSAWQLQHWAATDFFLPKYRNEDQRYFGRLYSFRDVVGLRALAKLRKEHKVALQELRRVGSWLGERFIDPWATLTFYVVGRHVVFDDPQSGLRLRPGSPSQIALPIKMVEIARETETAVKRLQHRGREHVGKVVRNRYVAHNAPVLAGTRIPTAAVWDFFEAGYSVDAIIGEYPSLKPKDVQAAIRYEQARRQKRGTGKRAS